MKIYAHRGCSIRYPENTLAAFRAALDLGVDGIELDVRCSADGIPVVIHDDRVDRTTDGHGLVSELTLAELERLDAGNGERISTLEDVLALVGGRAHLDLEIKAPNCEVVVLRMLDQHPDVQAAISSFDWQALSQVRSLSPAVELWVLTRDVSDEAIAAADRLEATTLAVHFPAIDRSAMERARSAGLAVMGWTVDSLVEAERLRRLGVAAICTNAPELIQ